MTLSPSTSLSAPVLDTTVLTPFDRIKSEVETAEAQAVADFGDYTIPAINKAVRSYLYNLRQSRASIDRVRKAQNDDAQAYIRRVNGLAKDLTNRVTALIEPHERIIKGIDEAEKERVAAHEADLDTIIEMRRGPHGGSAQIMKLLDHLTGIDPTTFEEFTPKADAEIQITREALETALQAAIDHEEAEAAREKKRAEDAEAARLKREAEIAEAAAAKATADAEAKAEADMAQAIEEAEAALEAERQKTDAAERKAAAAEARVAEGAQERKAVAVAAATSTHPSGTTPPEPAPETPTRAQFITLAEFIEDRVLDYTAKTFTRMLLEGKVHPAIVIDWSQVKS
jgi:hypothetical protein